MDQGVVRFVPKGETKTVAKTLQNFKVQIQKIDGSVVKSTNDQSFVDVTIPEGNYTLINGRENETLASLATLRRYSQDQKYKAQLSREANAQIRDEQLFHVKESSSDVHATMRRPFVGLCCQNCTFTSRGSLVKSTTEKLALTNILNHRISMDKDGFFPRTFPHLHQVAQLKKYRYPQVADLVLKDDRVQQAIERAAEHQLQESEDCSDDDDDDVHLQKLIRRNETRAVKLLNNMRSTLSDCLLRFTSWILFKLLPRFLGPIVVHPGQIKMLQECSKANLPIIFLPLHRSHLDYIMLSFILHNNNIRPPLVAAGDNLRIPFFGWLLRGLGAFFIKRRIDNHHDYVYKAILHTYINLCLKAGHNIEIFLEGGRTRSGKPCMPKYGLLSVIVESFMDGTIEDALLVPVGFNYEKLVDGHFVKEQLGERKEKETLGSALKGIWQVLNSDFGMVRVDFTQPFSLREFIKSFELNGKVPKPSPSDRPLKSYPSRNSLYGTDIVSDEHKLLVENISKHVIYDSAQSTIVMSTNALAFLLLTKYRNGATLEKLARGLEDLKHEVEFAGKDVGFSGDPVDVVNFAVDLLGPALVKKKKQQGGEDVLKPVTMLPNVVELAYYSNSVVGHFALESVIALALAVSEIRFDTVSHDDLMANALELCEVFQYEFLFNKPCQALDQVITSSIDDLAVRKEIFIPEEDTEITNRSRKLAAQFDDEEQEAFQKLYKLNTSKGVLENVRSLGDLLMPFVEAYAVTAFTLDKLVQRSLLESELIADVLLEMKNQLERGSLKYAESISVDSIKNALKLYQKWGVVECHTENQLRLYYLNESYDDTEAVQDVYNKINKYRTNNTFLNL